MQSLVVGLDKGLKRAPSYYNGRQVVMAYDIDGLMQDCSISSALAMEILQSCTKSSIWNIRVIIFVKKWHLV